MKSALPCILTINRGSSSIGFAAYEAGDTPRRRLNRKIDRIGFRGTNLIVGRIYSVTNGAVLPILHLNGLPECGKSSTALSNTNLQV